MKIAAVTDDGRTISAHFGRATHYVVVTVADGKVVDRELRVKPGHRDFVGEDGGEQQHDHEHEQEHGQGRGRGQGREQGQGHGFGRHSESRHARMLAVIQDCDVVLARGMGMGMGMRYNLEQVGKRSIITTVADVDEAVAAFLAGSLDDHPERLH